MTHKNEQQAPDNITVLWRAEEQRRRIGRIIRWSIGIPLILSYPWLGPPSVFLVVLGAILLSWDLSSFISGAFMNLIFPRRDAEVKPMYGIPEALMAKGLYAEAEQEYEKIIREFPDEVKPHIDMLNIAVVRMNNPELAEKIFQKGMSVLKDPNAKQTLSTCYESIRTQLRMPEDRKSVEISAEKIKETKERLERDRQKMWR
jgi:hypothetical protein